MTLNFPCSPRMLRYFAPTALGLLLITPFSLAQSPIGTWKTIDDDTGEAKSVVEFYEKDGKLFGKIVKILVDTPVANPVCDQCPAGDDRRNKPIEGLEIVRGLKKNGKEWVGGTVLDPEKGKIYDCKIWLEDTSTLKLRGYVAFFFRTQTWYKYP